MRKIRWLAVILIVILAVLGLGVMAWVRAPRLLEVTPAPGSTNIPPYTPVRLTFSRPVQPDSATSRITIQPVRNGSYSWEGNTLVFIPSQPWPSGATITVQVAAGMRAKPILSLPMMKGQSWSFSTSQTLLAYLWPAAGGADLYTLDPLTGDVRRITTTLNILDYSISADGFGLFYSVELPGNDTALWRQARKEAGGLLQALPAPETILECPLAACRSPRPSPDGKWLAYERTPMDEQGQPGITSVWLLSLDDRSTRPVSQPGHTTFHSSWSAFGWLSFYENERQGFVVQDATGREIGFLPNRTGELGGWHPEGSTFAAEEVILETISTLGTLTSSHLVVYDLTKLDSTGQPQTADLTQAADLEDVSPVYSPNGEWIAFARRYLDNSRWTPGRQLWLMRSDGREAHPLTQSGDYNHHDFAWSLDGQRLAFVRFNQTILTEPAELWLIDADGSQPIELVKGGYAPQWMP